MWGTEDFKLVACGALGFRLCSMWVTEEPSNSTPTSSSLVSSASLMTMFLCPAGNQVSSKSLSPDVPEKFDLSFSSTRAETIRMPSRFFYFSTLNVLKIIKISFQFFFFLKYFYWAFSYILVNYNIENWVWTGLELSTLCAARCRPGFFIGEL